MSKYVHLTPYLPNNGILKRAQLQYYAYGEGGQKTPICSIPSEKLKFIAGLWRIQRDFNKPVQVVRDKKFILHDRLPSQENNHFEYYQASVLGNNCYGQYDTNFLDFVVAKYEVGGQIYWGYGKSIAAARAFLGIRLYDLYQDVIHAAALQEKIRT